MKYYYVVLGSDWDLYRSSYSDLYSSEDGIYIAGLSFLYDTKVSKYLNSAIIRIKKIPLGWLLLLPLYQRLKHIEKPICFVLFSNWVEYDYSLRLLKHIKKRFPNSRFVWFMQDLIDTHPRIKSRINQSIRDFDITLSFDLSDCEKYKLVYHPLVFSSININQEDLPNSDIYFLGKAKNRLPEILKSYEILKSKGLKTDFYLVGVPQEQQIYPEEIHYIKGMSYLDNLKHLCGCKCALEIMQKGGSGYTQRVCEVLYFNKKIISNNQCLKDAPFYSDANMCIIDESCNIDDAFIENIRDLSLVNYNYREELSPIRLLEFIDYKLV